MPLPRDPTTAHEQITVNSLLNPASPAATPEPRVKISILGGGIVGLCLALALESLSVPFTLYESAARFSEIGARIMIGWNALRCLEEMGVGEEYVRLARRSWGEALRDGRKGGSEGGSWKGEVFFQYRFGGTQRGEPFCTLKMPGGQLNTHRAELLDLLLSHLPQERVRFRKQLVRFDQLEHGVRLEFADVTQEDADVLLAADGIRSTAAGTGSYAYRALVPSHLVRAAVGEEIWAMPTMWLEHSRHVVHYPVSGGRYLNVVVFKSDFTKGRTPVWDKPEWVEHDVDERELLRDYEGCGPQVRAILELVKRPSRWAMFDLPDWPYFVEGNVALLGDAAHAMTPHMGNGASQGIEDVHLLAHLLSHPNLTKSTVSAALNAYELVRKHRVQRVKELSYDTGRPWELSAPGVGDDTREFERVARETMDWVWRVDIGKQVQRAVTWFELSLE
ncbi:FAD/NADP-binding domain-containing protein [Dacryopinax primogenitus]|uniref:FAD/NADP-binding domain-containing protein n=1 Tax=Dacryopinax primogenitus (strain DJM 731) TaxID=1858805 RepID=M5FRG6_DACPD|nr:FAD/NADP-binding domain-containing protein [Dacryopinax primogenitus]EJT99715.1 FAD/NADP-binding domain-containing protein [Dacryopinax primogenitus]